MSESTPTPNARRCSKCGGEVDRAVAERAKKLDAAIIVCMDCLRWKWGTSRV